MMASCRDAFEGPAGSLIFYAGYVGLALHTPDVPGQFSGRHNDLVSRNIDFERRSPDIDHRHPGVVKMPQGKWRAIRLFGDAVHSLGPKAKMAVAVRDEIDQVAVR